MARAEQKIKVKVESPTSEFYVEVKASDKVKDLIKIVKKVWGSDYMLLSHNSVEMKGDQTLSTYGVKNGSVIKVTVFAEEP
ncbi:hypothetical protein R3W88_027857 [Solanum pinnatisectum]|uniref:Ubiquitin-like domain-containing protein n=2 Tax=Solanum TaxID=4107 RepID=A0ABQ7WFN6_SOLTU|nr:hypothetical protein KY284_005962 [Solanum tuberosum]KAH0723224.1 hypothetical protein KY289_006268 [Solanum tuberosum]KAH0752660.1 hypothetical protein KY285_005808 [Solanum tuberosum]KAH0779532.1 hypothetical protein KY290_005959 [Solanum tuberosum]KAK4725078.1 hypothetical protein R3W88_027857 [Solanum pinnatisectum]